MKPYIPYRDAAAFELRRTAYLVDANGAGAFSGDDDASFALGDEIGDATVKGITYSLYALYDGASGPPSRHITDEPTPTAIRAYGARIGRGRRLYDLIPDGRAGETIATPALIAWARWQAALRDGRFSGECERLLAAALAKIKRPETPYPSTGAITPGEVAFYEDGKPWRFLHKSARREPLLIGFLSPGGEDVERPEVIRAANRA